MPTGVQVFTLCHRGKKMTDFEITVMAERSPLLLMNWHGYCLHFSWFRSMPDDKIKRQMYLISNRRSEMRTIIIGSMLAVGFCQVAVMAFCPTGLPDEIFCDDFETYCAGGGFPVPEQPRCTVTDKTGGTPILQQVWYPTSRSDQGVACGTSLIIEDTASLLLDGVGAARYPSKVDVGQVTVRDWESPPIGEPGQILDLHRFIGNVFGSEYAAVAASDSKPLVMQFFVTANIAKLFYSSGYMELALGDHTDYLNRANTDYALWPKVPCCNGLVAAGPWPVLCAQGNPAIPVPMESGCPSVFTDPPPVHNAVAVGALAMLDTDPCHCGDNKHAPANYQLSLFDGQLWWTLRSNSPYLSTGTVAAKDGGPLPPPSDINPGDFALSSPSSGKSYNYVTLTIKTSTLKVEMTSWLKASNGYVYIVTNVMDNIPLKYTGPFDRIRAGVGPGCELASSTDWSTCKTIDGRHCLATPDGYFVDFDDFVLHGGYGYSLAGACCDAVDGSCTQTVQEDCTGRWTSSGQRCEDTVCCPHIYGDTNADGSVDMTDFAVLQTCITTGGGMVTPSCACFDYNTDNMIGNADVQHFADCANGPGVPGDSSGSCAGRGW